MRSSTGTSRGLDLAMIRLQRHDRCRQRLPARRLEIIVGLARQHVAEAERAQRRDDDQDREQRDDAQDRRLAARDPRRTSVCVPDQALKACSSRRLNGRSTVVSTQHKESPAGVSTGRRLDR